MFLMLQYNPLASLDITLYLSICQICAKYSENMPNASTRKTYPVREKRRPAYLGDYTNHTVGYCFCVNQKSYKEACENRGN